MTSADDKDEDAMKASEITVLTGPYVDREESLQDYCLWMEDQVQMLRTVVASLIARHPELFIGEDLEHRDRRIERSQHVSGGRMGDQDIRRAQVSVLCGSRRCCRASVLPTSPGKGPGCSATSRSSPRVRRRSSTSTRIKVWCRRK
jgi:hypothetical protein